MGVLEKIMDALQVENSANKAVLKNDFIEIKNNVYLGSMAFIDGGNAEIFCTSSFCFGIIKTSFVIFKGSKRAHTKIFEFYILINTTVKNNEVCYNAEIFTTKSSKDNEDSIFAANFFKFNASDNSLTTGHHRADINIIPQIMRRLAEIRAASYVAENYPNTAVVFDGNLEFDTEIEKNYIWQLLEIGIKNNTAILALSKTSNLLAKNGVLFSSVLGINTKLEKWHYKVENEDIFSSNKTEHTDIYFAKLHQNSKHVFKVEVFNRQNYDADKIFSALAENSKDAVFIGYPYGLIEADRLARVSNKEADYLRNSFMAKLGKFDVNKFLIQPDAHSILDKISF